MKRSIVGILSVLAMICLVVGCGMEPAAPSADDVQTQKTEQAMQEANRQVGMPAIVNFRERRLMKMILELRDQEDLVCYAYAFSEMTGKFTFLGRCIGYGLPYSVQYTNPDRLETGGYNGNYWGCTIPQPDPNGLFMPDGLSATWVMLIGPDGQPRPMYFEPVLSVVPFPLADSLCTNPALNPDPTPAQ